jgi:hypothetical protein
MTKLIALTCAAVALTSTAPLANSIVIGAGVESCGTWTNSERNNTNSFRHEWVMGYVSSYNFYSLTVSSDVSQGIDPNGLIAWITNYCTANPLNQIATATIHLIEELRRRTRAR